MGEYSEIPGDCENKHIEIIPGTTDGNFEIRLVTCKANNLWCCCKFHCVKLNPKNVDLDLYKDTDLRDHIIYIAQPYKKDPDKSFKLAIEYSTEIADLGYYYYSPILNTHLPSLDSEKHNSLSMFWYKMDLFIIKSIKNIAICLCPGWEDSKGCLTELKEFLDRKLPYVCYKDLIEKG